MKCAVQNLAINPRAAEVVHRFYGEHGRVPTGAEIGKLLGRTRYCGYWHLRRMRKTGWLSSTYGKHSGRKMKTHASLIADRCRIALCLLEAGENPAAVAVRSGLPDWLVTVLSRQLNLAKSME